MVDSLPNQNRCGEGAETKASPCPTDYIDGGWTDPFLRPYEGLWAAGIQDNGEYRSFCVDQLPLKQSDTNSVAIAIQKRLETLQIDQLPIRIAYIMGDSATVNLAMVRISNDNRKNKQFRSLRRACI